MKIKERIDSLRSSQKVLKNELNRYKNDYENALEEKEAAIEARSVLQIASKKTQENIEIHFSELVTTAFKTVFKNPYKFKPEFVERRNQTECDLFFEKTFKGKTKKLRPKFSSGFGYLDIAALALRLAYWKLEGTMPVIVLDEPFRNLSKKYLRRASALIKTLSTELGIQLIIVTHISELTELADRVFEVEQGKIVNIQGGRSD